VSVDAARRFGGTPVLIPYKTNAPVYHWPFATVGLIGCNVAAFASAIVGKIDAYPNWILTYGDGLHPKQWLLSMFMHGGFMHLAMNMLFLWVFGLIVEGKIGWWKFLFCYLGIGITQSMIEQFVMLGYNGDPTGSLGASAAIFGLIGMAAIWAPLNDIECWFGLWLYHAEDLDVPVYGVALLYAGLEMLSIVFGVSGAAWLHLGGMAIGVPLASAMLGLGLVDCERWDIFNVIRGTDPSNKIEPEPTEVFAKVEARKQRRDENQLSGAKEQFAGYLKNGNAAAAYLLYEKMKDVGSGLQLERNQLAALIKWLHTEKRWKDSTSLMAELVERFPENADPVRIKLAQICVVELDRPGKALDLLSEIHFTALPEPQQKLARQVSAKARQMQSEGVIEFDVDRW
jgi:membrane associated rhomboid family serine protease